MLYVSQLSKMKDFSLGLGDSLPHLYEIVLNRHGLEFSETDDAFDFL
jgi:hypothetical protein